MSPDTRTLLLITASSPDIQRVRRSRVLNFHQVTMPYLASFVPAGWKVLHVDEAVEPVAVEGAPDLVAITFHTPSAPHAYALAARFRERGSTVALGGPHVTLMADEAQSPSAAHASTVLPLLIFTGDNCMKWLPTLNPVSSLNSRNAASSGSSPGSIKPFGMDHAPTSLPFQNGPPG